MIRVGFRSLQMRLAMRLAALYIIATAVAAAVLIYRAYDTAGTLNERELSSRASDLAHLVSVAPNGTAVLNLPANLAAAYHSADDSNIFAVRAPDGHVIASSPPSFGEVVSRWPPATDDPSYFHLKDLGARSDEYYGLSVSASSAAGVISISVARAGGGDLLVHSLLQEFVLDISWMILLLVLVTLIIGVLVIRSGLKSVRDLSGAAANIGPSNTSMRLADKGLPSEITPLVTAFNRALDRLAQGFAVQRQFTANAAHELRTPLAIITAALDAMEGSEELSKLKADVARMNRLVEQLLRVARLDAVALDVSEIVDLKEVAANVAAALAPLAVARGRAIAFADCAQPIQIKGNAYAIGDAVRNVVENAISHSPQGSEVSISAHSDGTIEVTDRGPGIPTDERPKIFDRFWRGRTAVSQGAGLGLAIVQEIMKAHKGTVEVRDNPNGGAVFILRFPLLYASTYGVERSPAIAAL
jgi:two-component system, OmpR family, sensor histidine kinase TctE